MTENSDTIVEVSQCTKVYPATLDLLEMLRRPFHWFHRQGGESLRPALKNVSFTVKEGECFGIIGPNGSGKTTLLKILATLIIPTKGSVKIAGMDVITQEIKVKRYVGYVPADERSFFWRLNCLENLRFFGLLYGLSPTQTEQRIHLLVEEFGMNELLKMRFSALSSGKKQLLSLIRGLLIDPKVIIVDEPTRSLDMETAQHIREYLKLLLQAGKTLVIASHSNEDIATLCHRVAVLARGCLIAIKENNTSEQQRFNPPNFLQTASHPFSEDENRPKDAIQGHSETEDETS